MDGGGVGGGRDISDTIKIRDGALGLSDFVSFFGGDYLWGRANLRGAYLRTGWPLVLICTSMYFLY